jgi:hypothetical protein
MQNHTDISDLIAKYITASLTEEEQVQLNDWLEDPYNKLQFDKITSRENVKKNRAEFEQFNPEEDWGKLDRRLSGSKHLIHWLGYAAAVLLPVGIALWAFLNSDTLFTAEQQLANEFALESGEVEIKMHDGEIYAIAKDTAIARRDLNILVDSANIIYNIEKAPEELKYNTIRIPKGKQYQLSLSDGTKVWLNADTRFKYPLAFVGNKREVYIENGEVYFDVAKNKEKPFVVHFNNRQVRVLGTQFNIKAYEENNTDLVTLAEGSIQIDSDNSSVELVPNQQAVISKNDLHMKINTVEASIYSAWKNKRFLYKQERLEEIMNDLARFYNIKVFYRNQEVKEQVFTLRLSQEDKFETILENFELTGKVQFEINRNNIIIQ